ncbi:MAG TPA: ABC transporter permease [Methanosarcinales archaeon]|nr:ABC transporter permease [Methanosarcinales archaeon]
MNNILTIAKWEFKHTKIFLRGKEIIISIILLIAIALASLISVQSGFHIDDDIYTVVVNDNELKKAIETDNRFNVIYTDPTKADLFINGRSVSDYEYRTVYITPNSVPALDALEKVIKRYNEMQLLKYNDINNTFPVWIRIHNVPRTQVFQVTSASLPAKSSPAKDTNTLPSNEENNDLQTPVQEEDLQKKKKSGNVGKKEETTSVEIQTPIIKTPLGSKNQLSIFEEQNLATPSHFNPPIPFKSVLLSFLFIFPMYFIAQFYAASIMEERINNKGEFLLVSPLPPRNIVLGKMLPYFIITIILLCVISLYVSLGLDLNIVSRILHLVKTLSLLIPVILLFLSTCLFAAIIARSFKELTFILVTISVLLSGYLFFPAMFSNIHAVSSISPMSLVVKMLEHDTITLNEYLFSTIPVYLVSAIFLRFSIFIYREEDLFTQKSISEKIIDSIEAFLGIGQWFKVTMLSIILMPLAYVAQLMILVVVFNLPISVAIPVFIIAAALVEELCKSIGIYTVFSRNTLRDKMNTKNALLLAFLSGFGFFLGEKILVLITLAAIKTSVFGSVMGFGLLLFPLLLHITSTSVTSLGMRYFGTKWYLLTVLGAVLVHSAYNLYIVRGLL